jgi:asparagine synthase (glutamine-hydrolysing)
LTAEETRNVLPLLARMYDEPFADSSQIPTYLVSRLARRSVTVSLSGDGGDELFGGYNRYFVLQPIWNSMKWISKPVRKMAARLIHSIPPQRIDRIYSWARPALTPGKRLSAIGDKAHKLATFMDAGGPSQPQIRGL